MTVKKTVQLLWELVSPFEGHTEDLLIVGWRWWIKEKYRDTKRFVDIVAVGMAEDKTVYAKGFCPLTIGPHAEKPSIVLRSMVQSKLVMEKGPMPAIDTHQLVLIPLPSLWLRSSIKNITQFVNDWNGKTESMGLPYCYYTTLR